jgi:toxin ParE1/3/4
MRIVWSDQSLEDIEEIRRYIQRDSQVYAEMFVDRIFESAERLLDHPLSGRVVPEFEIRRCARSSLAATGSSIVSARTPSPS